MVTIPAEPGTKVEKDPRIGSRPTQTIKIKDSKSYSAFRVFNGIAIIVICAVTLYPFMNIIAQSFSSEGYINAGEVNLIPRGFNVTTFEVVMSDSMFWRNYANTVIYTLVATAIAMVLTTCFAYALSKRHLKGRSFFIGVAVFTMLAPNSGAMSISRWASARLVSPCSRSMTEFRVIEMDEIFSPSSERTFLNSSSRAGESFCSGSHASVGSMWSNPSSRI